MRSATHRASRQITVAGNGLPGCSGLSRKAPWDGALSRRALCRIAAELVAKGDRADGENLAGVHISQGDAGAGLSVFGAEGGGEVGAFEEGLASVRGHVLA
jgi:hypothetical protein